MLLQSEYVEMIDTIRGTLRDIAINKLRNGNFTISKSKSSRLSYIFVKSIPLGLIFFNTWFTDFFFQNIKVEGGKKVKIRITKKNFFYSI